VIDEEITLREKGYRSSDLSYGSGKRVWAVCDNIDCAVEGGKGRWVEFRDYRGLCLQCANRTDEHCKKTSDAKKGKNHPMYGKHHSEETRRKMSDALKGENHPMYGKTGTDNQNYGSRRTEETCRKISDALKGENHPLYGKMGKDHPMYGKHHTEETRRKMSDTRKGENNPMYGKTGEDSSFYGHHHTEEMKRRQRDANKGENNPNWKGGISLGEYCKFFNEPLKDAVRNYFDNLCFACDKTIDENKNKNMSVHHVNYQKSCGCDNTQFCIYVPLCMSCHITTNFNRWYWYTKFMTELAIRNPNYYAYHIPVVYYDEPSYNYEYVFEKVRIKRD
jgi:hypothetical protein